MTAPPAGVYRRRDEEEDMAGPLRLMTVHAHPDDESSKGAATCARYRAEGHEVMVVTCTGGDRGAPRRDGPGRRTARRAAPLAGFHRLRVPRGRPETAAARGLFRRRRPD